MEEPLISIVVPVYNVEKYINHCIDSILLQTYKNYELILLDDGSTDCSSKICDTYARKYEFISVMHKINEGVSAARNCALKQAKGNYITFVDSDDCVSRDYLERLATLQKDANADISVVGLKKINKYKDAKTSNNKKFLQMSGREALLNMLYQKDIDTSACALLIKRKIVQNFPFPQGKLHEDDYTTYKYFLSARIVALDPTPRYFYLQREGSIMHTDGNAYIDEINAGDNLEKIFSKMDNELWRAAKSKKFSNYCQVLLSYRELKQTDNENYRKITKWLKHMKIQMIFNRKTRVKNKVAAFALLFGKKSLYMVSRLNNLIR